MSLKVVNPGDWVPPRGYANAMLGEGRVLFVAGQVGWDPRTSPPVFPETFAEQFDRTLQNVVEVVRAAGGTPEQIARMTIYVTDKKEYQAAGKDVGAAWRKHLGKHYPAMALVVVADLLEDAAKVEIEATAVL